jgi:hypothetical protein
MHDTLIEKAFTPENGSHPQEKKHSVIVKVIAAEREGTQLKFRSSRDRVMHDTSQPLLEYFPLSLVLTFSPAVAVFAGSQKVCLVVSGFHDVSSGAPALTAQVLPSHVVQLIINPCIAFLNFDLLISE